MTRHAQRSHREHAVAYMVVREVPTARSVDAIAVIQRWAMNEIEADVAFCELPHVDRIARSQWNPKIPVGFTRRTRILVLPVGRSHHRHPLATRCERGGQS